MAASNHQARDSASLNLAGCESELAARYGQEAELNVVNKRRHRYGTKVRMAVRMDADNTQFATCWVPSNDIAGLEEDSQETMVASTEQGETKK